MPFSGCEASEMTDGVISGPFLDNVRTGKKKSSLRMGWKNDHSDCDLEQEQGCGLQCRAVKPE